MSFYHTPVMSKEVISFLDIKKNQWYVDCNLGGGGHTDLILENGGKVLAIDIDPDAIYEVAQKHNLSVTGQLGSLLAQSSRLRLHQANFSSIDNLVREAKIGSVAGVLFDLGVSSHQLEIGSRGFSFNTEAPLDMRMFQKSNQATAADLVNGLHQQELQELFWKLGEERFAKSISKKIIQVRSVQPITSTDQLAKIITSVRKRSDKDRTHPATRVFQALRIAVNDELNSLREALPRSLEILQPKGRLVVLTFHSLEDRIVKEFFLRMSLDNKVKLLTDKPISPSQGEVEQNSRARSGKMRVAEKLV